MNSKTMDMYLNIVEANLVCGKAHKKRIIESVSSDIYDCFEGYSDDITFDVIADRFGAPEELASSFLKDMEGAELRTRLSNKRCVTLIAVLCAIVLVAAGVAVGAHCYKAWHRSLYPDGYIEETPVFYVEETELLEALKELYGEENVY